MAKDKKGNLIANVFIAESFGYSSDLRVVVSLGLDGKIIAVKNHVKIVMAWVRQGRVAEHLKIF